MKTNMIGKTLDVSSSLHFSVHNTTRSILYGFLGHLFYWKLLGLSLVRKQRRIYESVNNG